MPHSLTAGMYDAGKADVGHMFHAAPSSKQQTTCQDRDCNRQQQCTMDKLSQTKRSTGRKGAFGKGRGSLLRGQLDAMFPFAPGTALSQLAGLALRNQDVGARRVLPQ